MRFVARMASKFDQPILDYCAAHGVAVPAGFARHTPSRYVIIRKDSDPPKLVARTWFSVADLTYYIENYLTPELAPDLSELVAIFDFETGECMDYSDGRLMRRGRFS